MSHEIRTPLNAINGMVLLAAARRPAGRAVGAVENADQAGKHLLGLINDVLSLSKLKPAR